MLGGGWSTYLPLTGGPGLPPLNAPAGALPPAYRIDFEERDLVLRLPRELMGRREVSHFVDFLQLASIRQQSELTEEDAASLAAEIDRAAWDRIRHRVEER